MNLYSDHIPTHKLFQSGATFISGLAVCRDSSTSHLFTPPASFYPGASF